MSSAVPPNSDADENLSVHEGEADRGGKKVSPWSWVLTVNYAQGLQYIFVTNLAIAIWFTMGVSPGESAFWAALLGFPWMIKPLWGPLVDRYGTKRTWTVLMQFIVGLCFLFGAFAMQLPAFFALTVAVFVVVGFAAASHDIACDGFYMLALRERQQAFFVGIRSTCFRLGWVTATGAMPILAGFVQERTGPDPISVQTRAVIGEHAMEFPEPRYPTLEASVDPAGFSIVASPLRLDVERDSSAHFFVKLSAPPPPDETVVLITEQIDGPKDFSVEKDTSRHEFTTENWDVPTTVTINLGKKIRASSIAEFKVSSGNIKLAWSSVFGATAFIFFLCAAYHSVILPRPYQDFGETEGRPPFYVPLAALIVAVGIPAFYCWGFYRILWEARDPLFQYFVDNPDNSLQVKGFDFVFGTARALLLIASFVIIFSIRPVAKALGAAFYHLSDISRIGFADVFVSFFRKPGMLAVIGFLLTFRLGEIQVSAISNIFLLAPQAEGGLALSLGDWGVVRGITYVIALLIGGVLGGLIIAKYGLKRVIWPMVLAVHLPNLCYYYLAWTMPELMLPVHAAVAVEAFGYGLGLPAFLMVMIQAADGPYKTSHYALCTGFMALGAMIPGMFAGFLSEVTVLIQQDFFLFGGGDYRLFFLLVMIFCLPGLAFIPYLPIKNFGPREKPADPSDVDEVAKRDPG